MRQLFYIAMTLICCVQIAIIVYLHYTVGGEHPIVLVPGLALIFAICTLIFVIPEEE